MIGGYGLAGWEGVLASAKALGLIILTLTTALFLFIGIYKLISRFKH
jgi:hypothetical protein